MRERIQEYLSVVGAQIRWKAARPNVLRELENHLEDQCEACLAEEMTPEQAEKEAVRRMGDPVEVGKALDKVHRPKPVNRLIAAIAAMLLTSLLLWLFVFYDADEPFHWVWMPLLCSTLGLAALWALLHLNWNLFLHRLRLIALPAWIVITVGMSVLYPPMSGRWGDYCALLTPITFASVVYGSRGKGVGGLLLSGVVMAGLMWYMRTFLYATLGMVCLYLTGVTLLLWMTLSGEFGKRPWTVFLAAAMVIVIGVMSFGRIVNGVLHERFLLSFYEQLYRQILHHARLVGPGERFTADYFGEQIIMSARQVRSITIVAEGDYFLASIIYRFGWLPGAALAAVLSAFLFACLRRGLRLHCLWGKMLSVVIVVPMLLQTVLHIVNNFCFFLLSSQLPLLSYGNTYRILDLVLLGLLLSVFRSADVLRDTPNSAAAFI